MWAIRTSVRSQTQPLNQSCHELHRAIVPPCAQVSGTGGTCCAGAWRCLWRTAVRQVLVCRIDGDARSGDGKDTEGPGPGGVHEETGVVIRVQGGQDAVLSDYIRKCARNSSAADLSLINKQRVAGKHADTPLANHTFVAKALSEDHRVSGRPPPLPLPAVCLPGVAFRRLLCSTETKAAWARESCRCSSAISRWTQGEQQLYRLRPWCQSPTCIRASSHALHALCWQRF